MKSKIIVALDYASAADALALVSKLDAASCRVKVGKELFTRAGPQFVEKLVSLGFDVFLDLKFHDIPNTVAKACAAAADLGVWMVNVHALGGAKMMRAAREAVDASENKPLLIAVTILTSMSEEDVSQVGLAGSPSDNVMRLAELAKNSGMDGVVCSPQETALIREKWPDGALVTPGVRPSWADKGDQVRVMTPADAVANGSSYLVVGRPITGAEDPMAALARIQSEL